MHLLEYQVGEQDHAAGILWEFQSGKLITQQIIGEVQLQR